MQCALIIVMFFLQIEVLLRADFLGLNSTNLLLSQSQLLLGLSFPHLPIMKFLNPVSVPVGTGFTTDYSSNLASLSII